MARRRRLSERRQQVGWSQAALARHLDIAEKTLKRWESGESNPQPRHRPKLADALQVPVDQLGYWLALDDGNSEKGVTSSDTPGGGEVDAWELLLRIEASDVSPTTIDAMEAVITDLCRAYTNTPPAALLAEVRTHAGYVARLLAGRATLRQRRDLAVLAGWLALLAACVEVDLDQPRRAILNRDAARAIGHEVGHPELVAWSFEVAAWQGLLSGRYSEAVELAATGRELAGPDTSAHVQLTMQEARAHARLGDAHDVHARLDAAAAAVDRMGTPATPDHHFVFDPRKLVGYTATTLAWLGDIEHGEEYARRAVDQYVDDAAQGRSVRRLATARIDLALLLASGGEVEEAVHLGGLALDSGRLVPSNIWRATELDYRLAHHRQTPDVDAWHDHYRTTYRIVTGREATPGA